MHIVERDITSAKEKPLRTLGLHCSDDSVTRRHRAALARQRDLGVEAEGDVHGGLKWPDSSQAA